MLDEWKQIKERKDAGKPDEPFAGPLPAMSQLDLMIFLLKRP